MTPWQVTLGAVLSVAAVVGAGALVRRLNWLTEDADHSLLTLVVRLLVPALIFDSIVGNPALLEARNLIWPPVVGFATVAVGLGLSYYIGRGLARWAGLETPAKLRSFAFTTGLHNYGYIPLPLIKLLFDNETLGVLFVHNLGVEIALWTVGALVLTGGLGRHWWKRVLNVPILAILLSLLVNALGLHEHIPCAVRGSLHMLGQSAIPLGLLLTGAIASDHFSEARRSHGLRVLVLASVLRLGLLPVLFLVAGLIVPATDDLRRVIAVQAAMPSAMISIVLARHYGADAPTAVRVALGTSFAGLVTIPVWLPLALKVLQVAQ